MPYCSASRPEVRQCIPLGFLLPAGKVRIVVSQPNRLRILAALPANAFRGEL